MNSTIENNAVTLTGYLSTDLAMDHVCNGEQIYSAQMSVMRLSGIADNLMILIPESLAAVLPSRQAGAPIAFEGQIRTHNKMENGTNRLLVFAFVRRLVEFDLMANPNAVSLTGVICRAPVYRVTPFGREITDLMIAVNRAYGKSDYIPCITWGRTAVYASRLHVGDQISLTGRFQSRGYEKQLPDGTVEARTALEVSVARLTRLSDENDASLFNPDVKPSYVPAFSAVSPGQPIRIQNGVIVNG